MRKQLIIVGGLAALLAFYSPTEKKTEELIGDAERIHTQTETYSNSCERKTISAQGMVLCYDSNGNAVYLPPAAKQQREGRKKYM